MKILIDADAFIALESNSDALHKRAVNVVQKLQNRPVQFWTTWDVINEVTTKLSYFLSKQQAISFLQFLERESIQIIYPTNKRHKRAIAQFKKITSKRVSLTDCMNMVVAKEIDVDAIFSFDKIYPKQGFILLEDFA